MAKAYIRVGLRVSPDTAGRSGLLVVYAQAATTWSYDQAALRMRPLSLAYLRLGIASGYRSRRKMFAALLAGHLG